tara:strand:+ start:40830 stop:40937 length:108 start_codon:yes stop_codon:yes gene_type:complete
MALVKMNAVNVGMTESVKSVMELVRFIEICERAKK